MTKTNNNARVQTLKRMLSVAKKLVENESNEIFELAHHIADNVLVKVCLLVGIEKKGEKFIYKDSSYGRHKQTKDFNVLYINILEKYYNNVPKYYDLIKNYHRGRNTYNHDISSLDFSIRKPIAMNYIECVENIMRQVGYLEKDELIKPSILISNVSSMDLNNSQGKHLKQKFKNFYNRLALKNPNHVIIDVKTLLDDIGNIELGRVLKMEYIPESKERIMLIEHKRWNLSIRTGIPRHLKLIKYINGNSQTYDFEIPNQNEDILNEFLDLIKDRFKEHGTF